MSAKCKTERIEITDLIRNLIEDRLLACYYEYANMTTIPSNKKYFKQKILTFNLIAQTFSKFYFSCNFTLS